MTTTGSHPGAALPGSAQPTGSAQPAAVVIRQSFWAGRTATILLQALTGVAILTVWQAAASARLVSPVLLGEPVGIIGRLAAMLGGETIYSRTIYDHLWASLQVVFIGYALGAVMAIALGFVFGRSRPLRRVFEPLILAIASVPKIAIAPLIVIVLGIGGTSRTAIVFVEVFFIVFFNTIQGVYAVDEEYVNISRIMGASRWEVVRRVILPAAVPDILLGLRLGVPFAMTGVVLGEFIASNLGIGWLILYSGSTLDANGLWAGLVFLVATTWILTLLMGAVEGRLLRWQPQRREGKMQV
jgi:NitT/TauT family transport system permease protein